MIVLFVFLAKHLAALGVLFLAAAGAGTLVRGARSDDLGLRCALGLAVWGHALFFLALVGQLRAMPVLVLTFVAIAGAFIGGPKPAASLLLIAPAFLLALHPPLAFDETLYHLPFVRALAESGELRFLTDLRFPVFPQFHELLCVPLFLLAGDTATHLVSLAELAIAAALVVEWGGRHHPRAGLLAAALFAGSPIVVQLGTITHVDTALTLFVAAGFYCLDRRSFALSGFFFGTACSVKYLGGFFAVAALLIVLFQSLGRRRSILVFAACGLAAALPMTMWLVVTTHNPVFPFLSTIFGTTPWSMPLPDVPLETRVVRTLRLIYDVTFARERVNQQPPFTPFLALALIAIVAAARRDARARIVASIVAAYAIAFSFLPQDSRYLVPLLPLISIAAAVTLVARWPARAAWFAWIAVAPGLLYPIWALAVRGLPPPTAAGREQMIVRRIPETAALARADARTVYVCGGERLKDYARGRLLGDVTGPYAYDRILPPSNRTADIAARLRRIDATWYLVGKRACAPPSPDGGLELVFEDDAAQLWRVQGSSSHRR